MHTVRSLLPLTLTLLAGAGCPTSPLPGGGSDGGANGSDGAVSLPDLRVVSCATLAAQVQGWLDDHKACNVDGDCTGVVTSCGLPGVCGAYLQVSAQAGLSGLTSSWNAMRCDDGQACPDCFPMLRAGCNQGVCGPKMASGAVGDPCQTSAGCTSDGQSMAMCLPPTTFPGGYCVLPCAHGSGCAQPGLLCRTLIRGGSANACFQQCNFDGDCRVTEGHHCCPSWDTLGGPGNVCYPGACP